MADEKSRRPPAEQDEMIRRLFEYSRELLAVVGADYKFKIINPAWTEATGWTAEDLADRSPADFIHPDDLPGFATLLRRLTEHGVGENLARVKLKDGGWRWFEGRNRLTADGEIYCSLRDAQGEYERRAELEDVRRTRLMLAKAARIGAWSFEPEDGRVAWSDEILAADGHAWEQLTTGEAFLGMIPPEDRPMVEAAFERGVTSGEDQTVEHRLARLDGGWATWRATFHCEPRPGGVYALKGISQDITELVEARDAALAAERQTRELVETAPLAVAIFDRDLRYVVTSAAWRQAFGLNHREHIGRTLVDVYPDVPRRLVDAQKRALKGEVVVAKEDRFADGQGGKHWVRWEARPWRDASGEIRGMLAYVEDISGVAAAKREAQTNARRLKMALNAAEAGVYEIDHQAKTFWSSPEFKKLVGRSSQTYADALALKFPFFHPDDMDRVRQAFEDIRDDKPAAGEAFEARVVTPSGGERWVRVFHHLKKDRKGRWLKGVGLVHDFDERKRQELALVEAQRAAEAAAEAKAAFLANMSHEIRTPMNGVMGVLHLLKTEALTDEGRRMLDEALSCGQMLSELLNDVIDFSKIEAGRLELANEAVDPAALAEGVVRLLRPQAEAKGLTISVEGFEDLGWVLTDPVRLRQALFNLVGNAVKFTLQGEIAVRACRREGVLRIEIEDTGVGIPADAQARIFQRFDQGDASTTRRFGGSGLGLAITHRLAEMMGGAVGFTSVEGRGSTFWLEVAAPTAEAAQAAAEATGAVLADLSILVVEDNATNRMIATKLLENLGADVETAADGYLGVEAAARGAFDLILMDVQMPGIDGLEAARRIRALGGAVAQVPIVALTANVLSHQRQAYLEAGMDGVVGKPISPASLLAEIARLGEAAPAGDEAAA